MPKQQFRANPFQASLANNASFSLGAETANTIIVSIQLKDGDRDLGERCCVGAYLSDDAFGDTLTATTPTAVTSGTDGVNLPLITGKRFDLISEADGDIDLSINYTVGAKVWYLVLIFADGRLKVSQAITFA